MGAEAPWWSCVDQVLDPVKLSTGVSAEVGDAVLAQAPHYKQSAVVAWLLEEEHSLFGPAAGLHRLRRVVLDVTGDTVAAGLQPVASRLQATDGALDNVPLDRIDPPGVPFRQVGENQVGGLQ